MTAAILVADIKNEISQRQDGMIVIVKVLPPAFDLGDPELLRRHQRYHTLNILVSHPDLKL